MGFAQPAGHPTAGEALTSPFHPYPMLTFFRKRFFGRYVSVVLSLRLPSLAVNQHSALWSSDFPRLAGAAIACLPQVHWCMVAYFYRAVQYARSCLQDEREVKGDLTSALAALKRALLLAEPEHYIRLFVYVTSHGWWFIGAAPLIVLCFFLPLDIALGYLFPVAWLWTLPASEPSTIYQRWISWGRPARQWTYGFPCSMHW